MLRSITGLKLIAMENSTQCCGAGGTYAITQQDFSLKLPESKMRAMKNTNADVIATATPECVMQLEYDVKREGLTT